MKAWCERCKNQETEACEECTCNDIGCQPTHWTHINRRLYGNEYMLRYSLSKAQEVDMYIRAGQRGLQRLEIDRTKVIFPKGTSVKDMLAIIGDEIIQAGEGW